MEALPPEEVPRVSAPWFVIPFPGEEMDCLPTYALRQWLAIFYKAVSS